MTKTEDGYEYPAEAYAYVPDPEKPSTWKLRLWEDPEQKITRAQLGRAAAALSPGGYRGNRADIPDEDLPTVKARIRAEYRKLGVVDDDIPQWVMSDDVVVRPAVLLETGEYPDKNLVLTIDDLDAFVKTAGDEPDIPIRVEHSPTPLDGLLGRVRRLWRDGLRLMGELEIPRALWELIHDLPRKGLSCRLTKQPPRILEVSLVRQPRVPAAAILAADMITLDIGEIPEEANMSANVQNPAAAAANVTTTLRELSELTETGILREGAAAMSGLVNDTYDTAMSLKRQILDMTATMQRSYADRMVDNYKRQGKISPAAESFAREILSQRPLRPRTDGDGVVELSNGERKHYADLFIEFLEAMPARQLSEYPQGEQPVELSAEQIRYAKQLGVDPETVLKYIER